jgi:hypothetical protein
LGEVGLVGVVGGSGKPVIDAGEVAEMTEVHDAGIIM